MRVAAFSVHEFDRQFLDEANPDRSLDTGYS